jgi:hypothetical protein
MKGSEVVDVRVGAPQQPLHEVVVAVRRQSRHLGAGPGKLIVHLAQRRLLRKIGQVFLDHAVVIGGRHLADGGGLGQFVLAAGQIKWLATALLEEEDGSQSPKTNHRRGSQSTGLVLVSPACE